MSRQRLEKTKLAIWLGRLLLVILSTSCGPALTDPSSHSVTGRWSSSDIIGPLTMLQLDLTQNPDGTVQGNWTGTVPTANSGKCPFGLGANLTGSVSGTNTVLALNLSILGTGDFQGQAESDGTLRGSVFSCGIFYPTTFTFVGPVPGG